MSKYKTDWPLILTVIFFLSLIALGAYIGNRAISEKQSACEAKGGVLAKVALGGYACVDPLSEKK